MKNYLKFLHFIKDGGDELKKEAGRGQKEEGGRNREFETEPRTPTSVRGPSWIIQKYKLLFYLHPT